MKDMEALLQHIASLPNCRVNPSNGFPRTDDHSLPPDLKRFYELCGGVMLFENKDYRCRIVSPDEFVLSNPVIVGEQVAEDISSYWFIVGRGGGNFSLLVMLTTVVEVNR